MGSAYDYKNNKVIYVGTELEVGDVIGPVPGARGVAVMVIGLFEEGGPPWQDGAVFLVTGKTKVPTIARILPPKGKKTPYIKLIIGTTISKIKGLFRGNKHCVETDNAVASCLGTEYQIITSVEGDEITVLDGMVNVLSKKIPHDLISLGPGESVTVNRFGVSKRNLSRAEYTHLSETFNRMFDAVSGKLQQPESSDTWAPIKEDQSLFDRDREKEPLDSKGWESIGQPGSSDAGEKNRPLGIERQIPEKHRSSDGF